MRAATICGTIRPPNRPSLAQRNLRFANGFRVFAHACLHQRFDQSSPDAVIQVWIGTAFQHSARHEIPTVGRVRAILPSQDGLR